MEKLIDQFIELPLGWMLVIMIASIIIAMIIVWKISGWLNNMMWGAAPWDDEGAINNIKKNVVDPLLKKDNK